MCVCVYDIIITEWHKGFMEFVEETLLTENKSQNPESKEKKAWLVERKGTSLKNFLFIW